jgi:hypothetical protein
LEVQVLACDRHGNVTGFVSNNIDVPLPQTHTDSKGLITNFNIVTI